MFWVTDVTFTKKPPNGNICRKLLYDPLLYLHCPHSTTFVSQANDSALGAAAQMQWCNVFCSPADQRTSCTSFQSYQPAKEWLFLSTCWYHRKVKAETCPPHVECEASCPRVILISGCLQGVLWKGIVLTFPPNGLPTHVPNWQLNLKEFTRRKLLKWWSFLWFMHWYRNVSFQKEKNAVVIFIITFSSS